MKTAEIKDMLKKEILIVEIATGLSQIRKNTLSVLKHDGYILLGKPDEIKDDDAKELVQYLTRRDLTITPKNYSKGKDGRFEDITFTESLLSAIESEIYWENPYGKEPIENLQSSTFGGEKTIIHRNPMNILWHEAESRTFYRNRSIILVKI